MEWNERECSESRKCLVELWLIGEFPALTARSPRPLVRLACGCCPDKNSNWMCCLVTSTSTLAAYKFSSNYFYIHFSLNMRATLCSSHNCNRLLKVIVLLCLMRQWKNYKFHNLNCALKISWGLSFCRNVYYNIFRIFKYSFLRSIVVNFVKELIINLNK